MPKTYNSLTVANAAAGSAILASDHAKAFENINNYRVPPACRVKRTTTQALTTATDTDISWDASAQVDTGASESPADPLFSSGAPTRITIRTTGLYVVTACVQYAPNNTGQRALYIKRNAAANTYSNVLAGSLVTNPTASFNTTLSVSTVFAFTAGDYITVGVFQNSGGSLNIASDTVNDTHCAVAWLGQVS